MRAFFNILGTLTSLDMLVIFIRIILTWFSGNVYGRPVEILSMITDPYLNWFRRFPGLRAGFLDLSPIVALAVLSMANRIFATLAAYGTITMGLILAMILSSLGSAVNFLLFFFIIILALRLIAYLTNRNIYSPFWRVIDTISQPLLFRINRIFLGRRIIHYRTSLILSRVILAAFKLILSMALPRAAELLARLPV
jgi:YggT family protein